MNPLFYLILFSTLFLSCNQPVEDKVEINYFGQTPPTESPLVFAENIISQPDRWEGNASFSSDGKTFYFNVFIDSIKTIYRSRYVGNQWEMPSPFEAIGNENNWEPFISLDNQHFYFVSSRPPGKPEWNGRIWKMERDENNNWSKPLLIDLGLSTDGGYWFPNTSSKGDLYFGGTFPEVGNKGKGDLYYWKAKENKVYNLENLIHQLKSGIHLLRLMNHTSFGLQTGKVDLEGQIYTSVFGKIINGEKPLIWAIK